MASVKKAAETAAEETVVQDGVEIYLKRTENRDSNVFVSINGVSWLIPRGVKTVVPKIVAEELERSEKAMEDFLLMSDEESRKMTRG